MSEGTKMQDGGPSEGRAGSKSWKDARLLRERARILAREVRTRDRSQEFIDVVEFMLGQEKFAFESKWVKEVFPLRDLTPLPCTPAFVLGILNVRGQIRTVIDIRRFFDLPIKGLTELNKVLFLEAEQMQIGILADAILGVRSVEANELQSSLPTLTGVRGEYLRGVTQDQVAVLDAARILFDKKLIVQEEVEV